MPWEKILVVYRNKIGSLSFKMKSYISYLVFGYIALGVYANTTCRVVDLEMDTFEEYISSHNVVMVEFYAPW